MPSYIRNCIIKEKCKSEIDGNSAIFFNNLAIKLLAMSQSIELRIEEISNKVCNPETKGFILVSIDTPVMELGVKYEYIEYIKRYGPPQKGKFDPRKLNIICTELGLGCNYPVDVCEKN